MVLLEVLTASVAGAARVIGDHPIISFALGVPLLLFLLTLDWSSAKLPPRFSYFVNVISGKYEMESWGPVKLIEAGYKKHGPIFRIKALNKGITFLIGPEGNKFFYNTKDTILTAREVYHFTVPVFGKNVVYDAPIQLMQRQLAFLRKALNGKHMQTYVDKVRMECDLFFSKFPQEGEMHLHKVFSELIILTASRCLMGDEVRETMHSRVATLYEHLNDGMTRVSILFPYFPLEKHRLRDEARKEMVHLFEPVITGRRNKRARGEDIPDDFLQQLIDCKYEGRRDLTVDEIVGLLIACLFAGQHTSNITATWLGALIAHNKTTVLPKLIAEQRKVLGDNFNDSDALSYNAVQDMPYLHFCMKEALRLFPPIVVMMRTVQQNQYVTVTTTTDPKTGEIKTTTADPSMDVTNCSQPPKEGMGPFTKNHSDGKVSVTQTYCIPKGDIVVTSPAVTHRLPECFANPDSFEPERFLPPRNEGEDIISDDGVQTKQWKYIAFGEGQHQCLGRDFAFLQVKTVFSYLFHHFDFTPVSKDFIAKQDFSTLVAGPGCDCRVKFRRVNLVAEAGKQSRAQAASSSSSSASA